MMSTYFKTLNISDALHEKEVFEEHKALLQKTNEPKEEQVVIETPKPIIEESVKAAGEIKTFKVEFFNTTEAFRNEMNKLCKEHNITYKGIK